jgi:hypothetical protein
MTMTETVLANRQWHKPSSKSGSDWVVNDLLAFKITFEDQDSATFFGVDPLPHPVNIPAAILTDLSPNKNNHDDKTYCFLHLMKHAIKRTTTESAIEDFAQALFRLMRYQSRGFLLRSRVDLTFFMCGEEHNALTNVCVEDENEILLIVQDDKRCVGRGHPEAQLVAEAIAGFYQNNLRRAKHKRPLMKSGSMAGVTMCGTSPIFYKIPITQDLVDCIKLGMEPNTETKVLRHVPFFPDGFDKGMVPLGNRLLALKCYDAFKAFVFRDDTV